MCVKKTRVVYMLDQSELALHFGKAPSDLTWEEGQAVLTVLWAAFEDAFGETSGFSGGGGTGIVFELGFSIWVDHPEKLPSVYPSRWKILKREEDEPRTKPPLDGSTQPI